MVENYNTDELLLINTDLDAIPDEEPFEPGEKLLTLKKVSTAESRNTPGYKYLKLQLTAENDSYTGLIFVNVFPPGAHMKPEGQRVTKQNFLKWMEVLSIPQEDNGAWNFNEANTRRPSFYGMCTVKHDDYGRSIEVRPLKVV